MTRSLQPEMCGERYAPDLYPWLRSNASQYRVVDDLPLVPTTWMTR